jgi:glycosyltransferase involved in cell wall biosynthesis
VRVALLSTGYGPAHGVVGRHVQALANGVAQAGGTVEVLLHASRHIRLPPPEERISITVFPAWMPSNEYAISSALWSHLRNLGGDYDILHAHGEPTLPVLLVAPRTLRHLIFSPHYYASSQPHLRAMVQGRHHRLDRVVLGDADRVLCVSKSEAHQVRRYAPQASVRIVPNGIDVEAIRTAGPLRGESSVILAVDRLTRWAGIHRIISAMPALPERYTLAIAGRGRARAMLEAHADYLGVADRVRFLGAISDAELHRWLRTAAAVVTLKEESFWGGTVLNALCADAPVVASDIAAFREAAALMSGDGIRFLSRRASPFALAESIESVSSTRARVREDLLPTWRSVAQRTISIYEEVRRRTALDEVIPRAEAA